MAAAPTPAPTILPAVAAAAPHMIALRRDLHAHPELAFEETATAARVVDELAAHPAVSIESGVAGTGVVARITLGSGAGCHIALRADMDALPVREASDAPYASQIDGVSHACGHDGHVAILVTVASILAAAADGSVPELAGLDGTVTCIFQPAEEAGGGASCMIEAEAAGTVTHGLIADVDSIYGLHLWNYQALGTVGVASGPVMANSDKFDIAVVGSGGHGATPHSAVDAVVVAGSLITALQTVVARSVDPLASAVLSLGFVRGGYAHNVIADRVELGGTVRALDDSVRDTVAARIRSVCNGVASTFGATIDCTYTHGYPATVNAPEPTKLVAAAAKDVVGSAGVTDPYRTLCGEDFAYFTPVV
ncbi:amidohydrolase [Thecamonas trahens ATCC 50062]|uniref:Amidohydrolase n=1 Tax=Thecamonas trahens ATCC 50062 TaxID=461836 RepID=A0A0L0DV93_THETB|nr:amidohydrolase [Thecamonas trahens ATCC 50062]KNC56062.1 amidohydrolase [Thecamonas trahens ATCC 50062]|eukprot:XP_013761106.1 amidohydrolase [Thecamonas trahens ATCC 50062]